MVDDPSAYVDVLRADPKLHRKAETALKARLKVWDEARELARKAKGTNISVPEPGAHSGRHAGRRRAATLVQDHRRPGAVGEHHQRDGAAGGARRDLAELAARLRRWDGGVLGLRRKSHGELLRDALCLEFTREGRASEAGFTEIIFTGAINVVCIQLIFGSARG